MQGEAKEENWRKLLEPGEMFGDYTVEKLLGKGGMGVVYLMRTHAGERYAVKVMDADVARNRPDTLKRFLREAEFAITIRHPNLIPVHRVGQDPKTGVCYLVMDFMSGGSLADRLAKCKRLSVPEAISIVVQIAGALEVAHQSGVIHRDIKPDNILFDLDGTPKLADMGVAKFTDSAHKTTVTTTGMIIGTPAYMAPEQMMDSHHIDARADIYALGVVLYEMLTGSRPHEESTAVELLAKAIKGEPLPDVRTLRPEISAAIAYVLSLMCAPKPEERPSTPHAVVELVQQAEEGTLAVPKKFLIESAARRKGWKRLLAAVLVAVAILGAGVLGWQAVRRGAFAPKDERQTLVVTNSADRSETDASGARLTGNGPGVQGGGSPTPALPKKTPVKPPPDNRHRMAVLPFRPVMAEVDVFGRPFKMDVAGEALAARLDENLSKTRRFIMLDRAASAEAQAKLPSLDFSSADDLRRYQQQLGADYMVTGTVKAYPSPSSGNGPGIPAAAGYDAPFLEIAYRVIFMPTPQPKWSGTVIVPYSAVRSGSTETALASGMSKAAQEICDDIVANIYPMRVTAKTSFELVLGDCGKNIREGDMFDLFRQSEVPGMLEERIARIQLTRVEGKKSYATVMDGFSLDQIPIGAVVRRMNTLPGAMSAPLRVNPNGSVPSPGMRPVQGR